MYMYKNAGITNSPWGMIDANLSLRVLSASHFVKSFFIHFQKKQSNYCEFQHLEVTFKLYQPRSQATFAAFQYCTLLVFHAYSYMYMCMLKRSQSLGEG